VLTSTVPWKHRWRNLAQNLRGVLVNTDAARFRPCKFEQAAQMRFWPGCLHGSGVGRRQRLDVNSRKAKKPSRVSGNTHTAGHPTRNFELNPSPGTERRHGHKKARSLREKSMITCVTPATRAARHSALFRSGVPFASKRRDFGAFFQSHHTVYPRTRGHAVLVMQKH